MRTRAEGKGIDWRTSYYRGDYIYELKTMGEQRGLQQRIIAMRAWTSGLVVKWPSEGKVRSHDCRDRDRDTLRVDQETWATEE